MTAAELRQRWTELMKAATNNPLAQAIFDDPTNQEQAASALGIPNMVCRGGDAVEDAADHREAAAGLRRCPW